MKNGRENRTNGNEEKGEKEKEALRKQYEVRKGTQIASPKFFGGSISWQGQVLGNCYPPSPRTNLVKPLRSRWPIRNPFLLRRTHTAV